MQDKRVLIDLSKGLHEGAEASVLGKGWLTSLLNWVPEPTGGLRSRRGWLKGSGTGAPSTRKGWGIGHFARPRRPYVRQSATATQTAAISPRTVTATWGAATVAGSCLVARLYLTSVGASQASSWTITPPAGWVSAVTPDDSSRAANVWIYYKPNASSESGTVAFTFDRGTDLVIALACEIFEVPNIATSSVIDTTDADDDGASTTPEVGPTGTPSVPVGVAIAAFCGADSTDNTYSSPTNGFTATTEFFVDNSTVDLNARGSYQVYEDGVAKTTGFTSDNAPGSSASVMALFKAKDFSATDGFYFVADNLGAAQVDIYKIDRESLVAGSWELLESLAVAPDVVPVAFTAGLGALLYTHPSFASLRRWKGPGFTPEALTGPRGRFVIFHNQRIWVGGNPGRGSDLFFSAVLDPNSWNMVETTGDYVPISRDDGEFLEDGAPFGGGLVLAKQTTTWFLEGNGKSDFNLEQVGDFGAAPGRTVMATPIGVIVAGRKQVALWNGSSMENISKPIEQTYGLTGDWMSVARQDNVVYILDAGSGQIWCLDIETGSWRTETLGSGNDAPACLYNQDFRLLAAPKDATSVWGTLLAYREFPGTPRAKDFDTLTEPFSMRTSDWAVAGPGLGLTPIQLHIRLRQRGGNPENTGLTLTPFYDGVAQDTETIDPTPDTGTLVYRATMPSLRGFLHTFGFALDQTLLSGENSLFDIEEVLLEAQFQEKV